LRLRWLRWGAVLCVLVMSAPAFVAAQEALGQADLLDVEAAYVVNFVRFTQWPADREPADGEPYVIAVLGPSRDATVVSGSLQRVGERIGNHPLQVTLLEVSGVPTDARAARLAERLRSAHLVFDPSPKSAWAPWLAAIARDQPVLTVGVGEGFARAGGMISLLHREGRLVFAADPQSIRDAGLVVSSKVLRLAKPVETAAR
jgi:hypothetical protein